RMGRPHDLALWGLALLAPPAREPGRAPEQAAPSAAAVRGSRRRGACAGAPGSRGAAVAAASLGPGGRRGGRAFSARGQRAGALCQPQVVSAKGRPVPPRERSGLRAVRPGCSRAGGVRQRRLAVAPLAVPLCPALPAPHLVPRALAAA